MDIFCGYPGEALAHPVHLTIGSFDGLHRGHQMLLETMVAAARAEGCLAGLLTFDPHPLRVLRPELAPARLISSEERARLLTALGLDFVLILPFSREMAAKTASQFMRELVSRVPVKMLWVGPDFALGRGRQGGTEQLQLLGKELAYTVQVVPPFHWQGEPVRSSRVRALLSENGAVERAADLLGRPYEIRGIVKQGARRGRRLGIPTANLDVPPEFLVPAHGVYACWAWLEEGEMPGGQRGVPAVVNIGVRPTFDSGSPSVEAYLLGYDADLYARELGLSFVRRLRAEQRFPDAAALVAQIRADAEAARAILGDPPDDAGHRQERPWDEVRHTADRAIRLTGTSQRQLFARAARAMSELQGVDCDRRVQTARRLQAAGEDTAGLLVSWLNLLLLAQELNGESYTRFAIHAVSDRGLSAVAYGYPGAPTHTVIKAATYYDLNVEQTAGGWTATVTFDV